MTHKNKQHRRGKPDISVCGIELKNRYVDGHYMWRFVDCPECRKVAGHRKLPPRSQNVPNLCHTKQHQTTLEGVLSEAYDNLQSIINAPESDQATIAVACKAQTEIVEKMAKIKFNLKEEE